VQVAPAAGGVAGAAPATRHAQTGAMQQRTFSGSGTDEDIVVSSSRAYVSALNKMIGCDALSDLVRAMRSFAHSSCSRSRVRARI
jgi:2-isopropylmalate synthase